MPVETIQVGASAMPTVGLGLWKADGTDVAATVVEAAAVGYRHFDSAADYGNERAVGAGLAQVLAGGSLCRQDLWVTSKLWNTFHRPEHVRPACERTLSDLGLDYLDLYLIHFPIALKYVDFEHRYPPEWIHDPDSTEPAMEPDAVPLADTWGAMEALVRAGLVREIGVCNYNSGLLHDLMAYAQIKPGMLQVEAHPLLSQQSLLRLAKDYGMAVTAFSPFGSLSYVELGMAGAGDSLLAHPAVVAPAERLGRSPAQILLRWGVQRGTSVIPKTSSRARLVENLDVLDWSLSETEMRALDGLDQGRRFNDPGIFCEQAFGRFHPIYD